MKKNILITGASGYTGTKLASYFSKRGFEVFSLVRKSTDSNKINFLKKISKIYFYDGSYESLEIIFKNNSFYAIIHLAALAKYDYESAKIDEMLDANFRYGLHILEAISNSDCKNLINFSTYWQKNENSRPICLYATLKDAFENLIDFYASEKKINAISLRLTDIYGPDDDRPKIFTQLKNYRVGQKLKMSQGDQEINLIYIDDVLTAVENCLENIRAAKFNHLKYYVYGTESLTLRNIVDIYNQETDSKVEVEWGALPYRKNQIMKLNLGELLPNFTAKHKLKNVIKFL